MITTTGTTDKMEQYKEYSSFLLWLNERISQ